MEAETKKQCEIRDSAIAWTLMTLVPMFTPVFTVFPIFRSLYLSLSKYKFGIDGAESIGLKNYVRLAGSELFWKVMKNTTVFAPMTVIPSMVIGLDLAVLVNCKGERAGFIRTVCFCPVVMPMIAITSVWTFIYTAKNGPFDQLLIATGLKPVNVLSSKSTALPTMVMMYIWKEVGYLMVFFLSGIQSTSGEVIEAARTNEIGDWIVFRCITIPLLVPTLLFISTIAFIDCFKPVDHVVIITEGAPNGASTLFLYYIYQQDFTNLNYGVSSVLTVIMLGLLLMVSLPRFINQDRKIHHN